MSRPKESHFFAIDSRWKEGSTRHNRLFEHRTVDVQYYGESSTIYCIWPLARERIKRSLTDPRIIFLLRHPVERTISHFQWMRRLGLERKPLLDALRESGENFDPHIDVHGNYKGYLEFSRYSKYIPEWQALFGADSVKIVTIEELKGAPLEVANNVFDFLGLAPLGAIKVQKRNQTIDTLPVGRKPNRLESALRVTLPVQILRRLGKKDALRSIKRVVIGFGAAIPALNIDSEMRAELSRLLTEEIEYYRAITFRSDPNHGNG